MKCPNWLYRRIWSRGQIPRWVRWIWQSAHWCPEMDELLVIDNVTDCFCDYVEQQEFQCLGCGEMTEMRYMDVFGVCYDCTPLDEEDLF